MSEQREERKLDHLDQLRFDACAAITRALNVGCGIVIVPLDQPTREIVVKPPIGIGTVEQSIIDCVKRKLG